MTGKERDAIVKNILKINEILERYRLENSLYKASLASIANDKHLKCKCGNPPYDNGIYCPKCCAEMTLYYAESRKIDQ